MNEYPAFRSPPEQAVGDAAAILRYCREHYRKGLCDIVALAGMCAPLAIEAFSREVCAAHDELASSDGDEGFGKAAGLTASSISLVDHDDLELNIRIQDLGKRLRENTEIDHWRVQLRYMTLLKRPAMSLEYGSAIDKNPAGLAPIARGLKALCQSSGLNLKNNLVLLDRIEELLQARLPELYNELNGLLEHHGIEAAEIQIIQRSAPPAEAPTYEIGNPPPPPSALETLQRAMQNPPKRDSVFFPPLEALHETAEPYVPTPHSEDTISPSALNALVERLNTLQDQLLQRAATSSPGAGPATRAFRSPDIDLPPGQPASVALDTLALIFDQMFASPDLPEAAKAILVRLQIPLLQQATLDPDFLTSTAHPARALINRLTRAAIGLPPDAAGDHPLCVALANIADSWRAIPEANEADFILFLEDAELLIKQQERLVLNLVQPYIDLVAAHEAQEAALAILRPWLLIMQRKTAYPEIRRFIADYWLRVMYAAHGEGGATGVRWKDCEKTLEGVLWSVREKASTEERKRLLTLIPVLLKRLNKELDDIGISAAERTPFLDRLCALQSAVLRGQPLSPDADPDGLSGTTVSCNMRLLEDNGKLVQYLECRDKDERPAAATLPWREGDWIAFLLPDGSRLCGRVCWHGAHTGTQLLFNADWGYAVALPAAMLERQLTQQQARILTHARLFDEAAARALRTTLIG